MVAHPFRTATDTADSNVTDGGITETLYDALQKRTVVAFGPTEDLGDFEFDAGSVPLAIVHAATGYVYFYNADDTTTVDDSLTCLVTGDGRRYLIADASAIAVSSVLAIDNDPPVSPTDGDAYVVDTAPTGAWVGHAKDIALRTPRGWVFAQPQVGSALLNQETGLNIQYSAAGTWGAMATALDAADVPPEALLLPMGLSVEAQQNAPPGSPAVEEYYLVGTSASGDWAGHENDIAYYTSTSVWAFIAAYDGAMIFNKASDTLLTWFDATGDWRAPWPYQAVCEGRLTLESGVAISTTDQTAKATLHFTPFRGNNISLYVNGGWALRTFTPKSLSLSGYTTAKNYDIFGYDDAGVLALESLVWTNDTTRATALTTQDGILVKSGDATRRYLGTIRTSATGQTQLKFGSAASPAGEAYVGIWNYYNRVPVDLCVRDTQTSWGYATLAWRAAFNSTTWRCTFVSGVAEDGFEAVYSSNFLATSSTAFVGIGLDSITTPATRSASAVTTTAGRVNGVAHLASPPVLGLHYVQALEHGDGEFYGSSSPTFSALKMRWFY